MKSKYFQNSTLLIFFFIHGITGSAQKDINQNRTTIPLNSDWEFMYGYEKRKSNARPVTIPHTWNAGEADSGKKNYYRGDGSYAKHLFISKEYKNKRLFLKFEGVATVAWVFINGHFVGEHIGGYAAFTFEITDAVIYGEENIILVKVSNAYRLDALSLGGDFMKYGGIYRPVSLLVTEKVCITPLDYASPGIYITQKEVTSQKANVEVKTKLSSALEAKTKATIQTKILDREGVEIVSNTINHTISADATSEVLQSLAIANPKLWQAKKDPYLYQVEVSVYIKNQRVDKIIQPLGLRFFEVDPDKGFFLNGEYLDLYGVNRHQDKAGKGSALSLQDHTQDMDLIMEMGANIVRLSHYQHAQPVFDYANKAGLVLWAEIPLVGLGGHYKKGYYNTETLHSNGRQQLIELIRQNYNHPSVFFWGLFNELKDEEANPLLYIKELQKLAKKEDPYRPTVAASNIDISTLNNVTDVIAWNKYYGWYGEEPSKMGIWADEMHKKFPKRSLGISEYGAGASIIHHQDTLIAPEPGGKWHPEGWQTYFHEENWRALSTRPFIWGKMIWNMFDFASSMRNEGDHPGMNDKGLVTFDRLTKKDAFYFYKANWNPKPMLYLAEKRFKERNTQSITIKAYSNLEEIELFVNGISKGTKKPAMGICLWNDIKLKKGNNDIQVSGILSENSERFSDHAVFTYHNL